MVEWDVFICRCYCDGWEGIIDALCINRYYMRNRFINVSLIAIIFAIPIAVFAEDQLIIHPKDVVHEGNYIRAGRSVQVEGKVTHDVIVVGRDITLSGPIDGDVIVVGQSVVINSAIGGNLRVAAEEVTVNGSVGKNVTIAASRVVLGPGMKVGWDVSVVAQSASLAGAIDGGAWVRAQDVELAGAIVKGADIDASGTLVVRSNANVKGTLAYHAPQEASIPEGAVVDHKEYQPVKKSTQSSSRGSSVFWPLVFLFGAWVVGGVLLALAEPWLNASAARVRAQPFATLGWGIIGFIVTPILAVILAITLIGIPLSMVTMAAYVSIIYASKIIAGYMIAFIAKEQTATNVSNMVVMVVGVAIYVALINIPIVGMAIALLGTILTFGVVTQSLLKRA